MTTQSFLYLGISDQFWPLAPLKDKTATFWIVAILCVPVVVLGFIKGVVPPHIYFSQDYSNAHLGIELFGGVVALLVCITISITARSSSLGSPLFIMAFAAMGVFDVFHAFSPPNSNQFVFLHSLSVFWGGLLVFGALLIQRLHWRTPSSGTMFLGLTVLLLANLTWALYGHGSIPPMTEGGANGFALGSIILNSRGSVFLSWPPYCSTRHFAKRKLFLCLFLPLFSACFPRVQSCSPCRRFGTGPGGCGMLYE